MLYGHDYGSEEMRDLRAADVQHPAFEVTMLCVPPDHDEPTVRVQFPEVWAALRAEEQRISERIAQAAGGWTESAICYRLPTDVLELVDAVALCREYGFEVVTKSAPGDPTLLRVLTRPFGEVTR
jgi:hypothetical protein